MSATVSNLDGISFDVQKVGKRKFIAKPVLTGHWVGTPNAEWVQALEGHGKSGAAALTDLTAKLWKRMDEINPTVTNDCNYSIPVGQGNATGSTGAITFEL